MIPCSRVTPEFLSRNLVELEQALVEPGPKKKPSGLALVSRCIQAATEYAHIPRIRSGQEDVFRDLEELGIPILIDVAAKIQGAWDPATFSKLYGNEKVSLVTISEEGSVTDSGVPLSTFLDKFMNPALRSGTVVKVKVRALAAFSDPAMAKDSFKDWPDSACFAELCAMEYSAFVSMCPFPSFTSPEGCHNAAAHAARDVTECKSHKPDLGLSICTLTTQMLTNMK